MLGVASEGLQKQELVSLVTSRTTAVPVTPESGLVLVVIGMTPTRVETKQGFLQTMGTSLLRRLDLSWLIEK